MGERVAGAHVTTLDDALKVVRETIVMNERVRALSDHVDRLDAQRVETRERLIVLETMLSLLRPCSRTPRLRGR